MNAKPAGAGARPGYVHSGWQAARGPSLTKRNCVILADRFG
ncbi:MAG: hypothetical protein ACYCO9_06160 [Streptosporangiaceae bacterium]